MPNAAPHGNAGGPGGVLSLLSRSAGAAPGAPRAAGSLTPPSVTNCVALPGSESGCARDSGSWASLNDFWQLACLIGGILAVTG